MNIQWKKSVFVQSAILWRKTTLISGVVGGAGADPQTCKMRTSFFMSLALYMSIFDNFQY